ncbi:MAG TPA: hypothetical protein VGL23_17070 [Chloroflexota bacterium]
MDAASHELLDSPPPSLSRPLALVGGRAYAATWLYLRPADPPAVATDPGTPPPADDASTSPPATDPAVPLPISHAGRAHPRPATRSDQPPALPPPSGRAADPRAHPPSTPRPPRVSRQLFVLRDDGLLFGPGADAPLDALGLSLELADSPRDDQLWRRRAVDRYRRGERPDPADLLARLASIYDAFLDFDRSLADQRTMCELCACCSLATWLADAFPVFPYLWISGERGSGKSQLGTIWARTSYLGQIVLAGGSYPALRDLAQHGAALYFDDAEAFGGQRGQRAKRELLLAGNRRGATVPLKTLVDGRWQTRWVPSFTPRAFSAIALPDPTLASRAIVIPLARTLDRSRGSRDPADPAAWPCDAGQLQDDLWAFGLASLPAAAARWRSVDADPLLVGREFEKWRPILVVADLLADHGRPDLPPRLRAALVAYQQERPLLIDDDETIDVIRGLVGVVERVVVKNVDRPDFRAWLADLVRREAPFANAEIQRAIVRAGCLSRLADRDDRGAPARLGRIMARLRFRPYRQNSFGRDRGWHVSVRHILDLARAYGVATPLSGLMDSKDSKDTSARVTP